MDAVVPLVSFPPINQHSLGGGFLLLTGLIGLVIGLRTTSSAFRKEISVLSLLALAVGAGLMVLAWTGASSPGLDLSTPNPIAASTNSLLSGEAVYESRCLSCHGVDGNGDGPAGEGLMPPPANFHALHALIHPDAQLFNWIDRGKSGTGMPAFGDELTDAQIWDAINYLQAMQQGGQAPDLSMATPTP